MAKKEQTGYYVHSFIYKMGLKGVDILIYAAIYSFTLGPKGMYYGTKEHLASITGTSLRTVKSHLASLIEMGLIERVKQEKYSGVRCRVLSDAPSEDTEEEKETQLFESGMPFSDEGEPFCDCDGFDVDDEPLPDDEDFREGVKIMRKAHRTVTPKNKFYQFDKDGWVFMTEEQYFALAAIADADTISQYVARLSRLIEKEDYNPHNHYKTLREWILKDTGV